MGTFLAILAIAAVLLFAACFGSFRAAFYAKFGRSFVHPENIAAMVVWIIALACSWTVVCYICGIVLIILAIVQIVKYGFGWGLGVWAYNLLIFVCVLGVINTLMNISKEKKK